MRCSRSITAGGGALSAAVITAHVTVGAVASRSGSVEPHVLAGQVVVGQSTTTPDVDVGGYDVLLTSVGDPPEPWVTGSLDELDDAVRASPAAAVSLVHVLRATESVPIADGLTVESMAYSMLQHGATFEAWLRTRARRARREPRPDDVAAPVRLERSDARLDIVLQRSAVHNALNAAMRDALCDAFELVALDASITEVHLRGEGPSFCSGGDLDEFGTATDAAAAHLLRVDRSVGRRIHEHAEQTTVHLHGMCLGAGIELAAFAGHVVAAADTTIGLPEVAMGLIPGAGGTISLPRRIGRHRTAYLALTGARIDATLARAWRLVDEVDTA
jgi:hypothetical protein